MGGYRQLIGRELKNKRTQVHGRRACATGLNFKKKLMQLEVK
jgi:hypothetical protein